MGKKSDDAALVAVLAVVVTGLIAFTWIVLKSFAHVSVWLFHWAQAKWPSRNDQIRGPEVRLGDQGRISMTLPADNALPPPTGNPQYDALQRMMALDQWDAARQKLQQIAYSMVSESPEVKAEFTQFMKVFAERDPLLASVLNTVMPLVRGQPGILQTATYKHLPGIGVEEVRYAIYFAEQLGMLRREKKGNTYRLLPIGDVIDVDAVAAGHASQPQ